MIIILFPPRPRSLPRLEIEEVTDPEILKTLCGVCGNTRNGHYRLFPKGSYGYHPFVKSREEDFTHG